MRDRQADVGRPLVRRQLARGVGDLQPPGEVIGLAAAATEVDVAPGAAPAPGPMQNVQPGQLHSLLGIRDVREVKVGGPLAVTDSALT